MIDFNFHLVNRGADLVLRMADGSSSWAYKGGIPFAADPINVSSSAISGTGVHELGHTLGFGHAFRLTNDIMSYNFYN